MLISNSIAWNCQISQFDLSKYTFNFVNLIGKNKKYIVILFVIWLQQCWACFSFLCPNSRYFQPKSTFENSLVTVFVHFPFWYVVLLLIHKFIYMLKCYPFYHIMCKYFFQILLLAFLLFCFKVSTNFPNMFTFNTILKKLSQCCLLILSQLFHSLFLYIYILILINNRHYTNFYIKFINLIFHGIKWYLGWEKSTLIDFSRQSTTD